MQADSAMTRLFRDAGFTLIRCTNHAIWKCPCGHTRVVAACSIGRGRGAYNAKAQMNRALRGCTPQAGAA
jgi:hypothetical protein